MSWYRTGTVSLKNGSAAVAGVGTDFVANVRPGFALNGPDGGVYEVQSITGSTSITLVSPYKGADVAGAAYSIVQTQSMIADLAAQAAALLAGFGSARTDSMASASAAAASASDSIAAKAVAAASAATSSDAATKATAQAAGAATAATTATAKAGEAAASAASVLAAATTANAQAGVATAKSGDAATSAAAAAASAQQAATSALNAPVSLAQQTAVQAGTYISAAGAGTADAITAAFVPAVAALVNGMCLEVRAAGANTAAAPTFQANGTAAKAIVKGGNMPLVAGDIAGAGHWLALTYDAVLDKYVLQNPANSVSTALNATSINGGQLAGMRNRVINGAMMIDQRNQGGAVAIGPLSSVFVVDRLPVNCYSAGAGRLTVQRVSDAPPGFTASAKITVTAAQTALAATDFFSVTHSIEGLNVYDLDFGLATAKTVTVSFWVKSSVAGLFSCSIHNYGASHSNVSPFTINSANVWEYKTITVAGDTSGTWMKDNFPGVIIYFSLGMGANYTAPANSVWGAGAYSVSGSTNLCATAGNTFQITGLQFEAGPATPFERRPHSVELTMCQRYFEFGSQPLLYIAGSGVYGASAYGEVRFAVPKRGLATITLSGWQYYAAGANTSLTPTIGSIAFDRFGFSGTGLTNWSGWVGSGLWTAYAEI